MKKLFLFLFLVPSICAQIDFTTTFPKIGFGDFYMMIDKCTSGGQTWRNDQYYYPQQRDLGYNYLWGRADDYTFSLAGNLKILHDLYNDTDKTKFIYRYCWSGVNDPDHLQYQVGGDFVPLISGDPLVDLGNNFGFGNSNYSSWWTQDIFRYYTIRGNRYYVDQTDGYRTVFYCKTDPDSLPGIMLVGQTDPFHTWVGDSANRSNYNYTLEITAKIADTQGVSPTDTIAVISIWEEPPPSPIPVPSTNIERTILCESQYKNPSDTIKFCLTTAHFTGTGYQGIKITGIHKVNGSSSYLKFKVDWKNKCSLFIDKYSIYDQYYEGLFLSNQAQVQQNITSHLNSIPGFTSPNPRIGHVYIDEPASMYYRSIEQVSNYSKLASGNKYYIAGAQGNVTDWASHLDNLQRHQIPYVMSDIYPFLDTLPNTQDALDYLIEYTDHSSNAGPYKSGLRTMINYANNFTLNDKSDDKPFMHTIQVMREDWRNSNRFWYTKYRAPSANEIFVQGWLALCYGAKGLMYYCTWTGGDTVKTHTWGLLEREPNNPNGPWEVDCTVHYTPNYRFNAVQELNRQIDQVSSEILKLTWVNGYNIHKGESLAGNYISGITSYYYDDPYHIIYDNHKYVELGEFKKTTEFNDTLKYFLLVNRRCESSDLRHIVANFNITNSAYINWGIKDIGSGRLWTRKKTESLDDTLSPGTGKLYRLAPVVLYGGDLNYNETVAGPCTLTGDLTIKAGVTLIVAGTYNIHANITLESGGSLLVSGFAHLNIQAGSKLNFANNSGITVYGQLNADGATFQTNGSGTWGTITFDGLNAAGSVLNNITIKHGDGIQCLNGADITIENSSLDSCTTGIYIYNSQPSINKNIIQTQQNGIYGEALNSAPLIYRNVITKIKNPNEWGGIFLVNGSEPHISLNDIGNFDYGIYVGGGSCADFIDFYDEGRDIGINNRIMYNNTGICSAWGSYLDGCGENTILHNSVACNAHEYTEIDVMSNYWGPDISLQNPPILEVDETSCICWYDWLDTDPWYTEGRRSAITKHVGQLSSNNQLSKSITGSDKKDLIATGKLLEKSGKIDDAVNFYKNLITNDKYVRIALSQLAHIKHKYDKSELTDYFGSLLTSNQKNYSTVKKLLGDINLQNNQFDNAISNYNDVIINDPIGYDGISARFEKLFAYLHIKNDINTASTILSNIKNLNSNDVEVKMRIKIAENLINAANKGMEKKANLVTENVPKTYGLFQNFPNPFNPETTIRYQIPKPGMVTLKVYDILGREVTTLINENKIEGSYDFTFDASRFASGVYIYQLRVNDYVSSKKMIILK